MNNRVVSSFASAVFTVVVLGTEARSTASLARVHCARKRSRPVSAVLWQQITSTHGYRNRGKAPLYGHGWARLASPPKNYPLGQVLPVLPIATIRQS